MKFTTTKELAELLSEHFQSKIEGVNRARRSDDAEDDYHDEAEGAGVSYDESVDRARRGEDQAGDGEPHDYPEEDEGAGVTYETNLYTDADLEETNLYTDDDLEETNLYSDAEKEGDDPTKKKGKGHAAPSGHKSKYPGPPHGVGEGRKLPSLKSIFAEGKSLLGLAEVAPPGWEDTVKKMKKHKDIENPWALAWHMKGKGAKPSDSKKKK